jgi:hypothetical protein
MEKNCLVLEKNPERKGGDRDRDQCRTQETGPYAPQPIYESFFI